VSGCAAAKPDSGQVRFHRAGFYPPAWIFHPVKGWENDLNRRVPGLKPLKTVMFNKYYTQRSGEKNLLTDARPSGIFKSKQKWRVCTANLRIKKLTASEITIS
jgi:hypothetical protein